MDNLLLPCRVGAYHSSKKGVAYKSSWVLQNTRPIFAVAVAVSIYMLCSSFSFSAFFFFFSIYSFEIHWTVDLIYLDMVCP